MRTRVVTKSKFIVKPENKVVVCKMSVDMQLPKSECWGSMDCNCWNTKAPMVDYSGRFTVMAKAKCNSEDTFDEATGKKIAESRAKAKAFKIAKNVWNCIAGDLTEKGAIAGEMARHCSIVEEVEIKHTEELSK